nr:metalloendopeptidase [Bacillota bacterium]
MKGKSAITAGIVALSILIGTTAFAYQHYQAHARTVYDVYWNGTYMGTVSDPEVVRAWLDSQIRKYTIQQDGLRLHVNASLRFAERRTYNGRFDNAGTLRTLAQSVRVKAEAVRVVIDGKTVAYAPDAQTVQRVLTAIKSKYISGLNPAKRAVTVASRAGEAPVRTVRHVTFVERIDVKPARVDPRDVLTEAELRRLLETGTPELKQHVVQPGDCLSCIASRYNLTTGELLRLNPGLTEDTLLQIGQTINVTARRPKVTVKTVEEVTVVEDVSFTVDVRQDPSLPRGEQRVIQEGKNGQKRVTYRLVKENGALVAKELLSQAVLTEPVTKVVVQGTKVIASKGTGNLVWPTRGGGITSGFRYRWGRMHTGLDIAGARSRDILAADNGRVVFAGWNGGYGYTVILDHGNGLRTLYAHMDRIKTRVGAVVEKGQVIGVMGDTGNSTGVHLHFEVIQNRVKVNPLRFL